MSGLEIILHNIIVVAINSNLLDISFCKIIQKAFVAPNMVSKCQVRNILIVFEYAISLAIILLHIKPNFINRYKN